MPSSTSPLPVRLGAPAPRRRPRLEALTLRVRTVPLVVAGALVLAGCGAADGTAADDDAPGQASTLRVATSFYALQYATEQIGGDVVEVTSLTPPGVDPHDVELSPRQVRELGRADAVVFLSGFQPPVDQAVEARSPDHVLDVLDAARLAPPGTAPGPEDDHADHAHEDEEDHVDEADEADVHDHGALAGLDPHFWLDPLRMVEVGHAIADVLTEAAPEHAETFAAGMAILEAELDTLDTEYHEGLVTCERDVVVTGHTAFGYLARAYGFTEVGIAGIDPENEPSPARLREIRSVLERYDLTTVYTNSTGDASVAATLGDALGLEVAVLDPIEAQLDPERDYPDLMRTNLGALRDGLGCR